MKPSKKKPAKRKSNPIVSKLLDLTYRINNSYQNGDASFTNIGDKKLVQGLIGYVKNGTQLTKEQMEHCNKLWNDYNPSRMNNWESSRKV